MCSVVSLCYHDLWCYSCHGKFALDFYISFMYYYNVKDCSDCNDVDICEMSHLLDFCSWPCDNINFSARHTDALCTHFVILATVAPLTPALHHTWWPSSEMLKRYFTCFRSTALSYWMVMMIFTMEIVLGRIWRKSWGWRWGEEGRQRQCNVDDETSALERCLTLEACAPHQLNRRDGWLTENGFSFPPDSWQSRVVMENIIKWLKILSNNWKKWHLISIS